MSHPPPRSPSPPLPRGWMIGPGLGGQLHACKRVRTSEPAPDAFAFVPNHPDDRSAKRQKVAATDACRRACQKGTSAIGVPIAPCPITEPSQEQSDLVEECRRKTADADMISRMAAFHCFSQGKKR